MNPTPLRRQDRLLAELVVAINGVSTAITAATADTDNTALKTEVQALQQQLTEATANNSFLSQQLANANQQLAATQERVSSSSTSNDGALSLDDVLNKIGIDSHV